MRKDRTNSSTVSGGNVTRPGQQRGLMNLLPTLMLVVALLFNCTTQWLRFFSGEGHGVTSLILLTLLTVLAVFVNLFPRLVRRGVRRGISWVRSLR